MYDTRNIKMLFLTHKLVSKKVRNFLYGYKQVYSAKATANTICGVYSEGLIRRPVRIWFVFWA